MRTNVLGVGFDPVTTDGAVSLALGLMAAGGGAYVCTPNPEVVMLCREDAALMDAVNGADIVLADGVGIVWAAKTLGHPVPERAAGYDFLIALLEGLEGTVFILGGRPGVAARAGDRILRRFPNVTVVGVRDGYFTDEQSVLDELCAVRPDLVMVCLGAPKQELFMARYAHAVGAGLMVGLGGSVDVLAGDVQRAPEWFIKHGLEWLWRLITQPRRLKRAMRLPQFVSAVKRQRKHSWEKAD